MQKARELVDKKTIGKIKFGNAIFAYPGIQSYHPNPEPWFAKNEGGPVIDMGPYYLTASSKSFRTCKKCFKSITSKYLKKSYWYWPKKRKDN